MPPVLRRKLAQHVVQDAAVTEVLELVERIDAAEQWHPLERSVTAVDFRREFLPRLEIALQATNRDLLVALQADRLPARIILKGQRQDAHADEIGAMDALKALA